MTDLDTARATKTFISDLPSRFMLDGATYAKGGELGYDGLDFYVAGRAGTLGRQPADVIAAALVFFAPATVRDYWDRASQVGEPTAAGAAFAACGHAWGEAHLGDGPDHARCAALLERVAAAANPASAPLFAAWRALPAPAGPKARVLHFANALRELRGALHGGAILTHGVPPAAAVQLKSPHMAALFGWTDPIPGLEAYQAAWDLADAATDVALAPTFAVLDDTEQAELVSLCEQELASAS